MPVMELENSGVKAGTAAEGQEVNSHPVSQVHHVILVFIFFLELLFSLLQPVSVLTNLIGADKSEAWKART